MPFSNRSSRRKSAFTLAVFATGVVSAFTVGCSDDSQSTPPLGPDAAVSGSVTADNSTLTSASVQLSGSPSSGSTGAPSAHPSSANSAPLDAGSLGDASVDEALPAGIELIADFNMSEGFADGQSSFDDVEPRFENGLAIFDIPFAEPAQQFGWNFSVGPADYSNHLLLARVRLASGFNQSEATPGGLQLRAWSDDWDNFAGKWTDIDATSQLGEWVTYEMDLDDSYGNFDPTVMNGAGFAFLSSGMDGAAFAPARFEVAWIGLLSKGGVANDAGTTVDATVPSTPDSGGPSTGEIPEGAQIVSSFDVAKGFEDGQATFTDLTPSLGDGIGTYSVLFTGSDQQFGWNFNVGPGDYSGYELMARVRLVSGFNDSSDFPGGIQLRAWSDSWVGFLSKYTSLDSTTQTGQWIEYTMDLDTSSGSFDVTNLNAVGIAFMSSGTDGSVYSDAVFEVDWVVLVPKQLPHDGGVPDSGIGVDSGVILDGSVGTDSGVTSDGGSSPPDAGTAETPDAASDGGLTGAMVSDASSGS